jgi:type VI secretion system ImpJ/VasE family protein
MAGKGRVAWREGLFLRPQHFQQQDRHIQGELGARASGLVAYPWGITELQVDEDLAMVGKFGVVRCAGVMPDGTRFAIPDDFPPPEPLDIPADVRDGLVSLTLPAAQIGAIEFRESDRGTNDTRFLVDESDVTDAFSDDRTIETVEVARPNLRFGVTREQTYGRVTLGLARVREISNKRVMFDDSYIPPALHIGATRRLKAGLQDIVGRADQRITELAKRAVQATDGGAETFASFLILQVLNRWNAALEHLDALPVVHPERLFEALVSLAGELATLSREERRPPPFPRYDHENPQLAFDPVFDLLQTMLGQAIQRSAEQLQLDNAGPGAYVATIRDHSLFQHGYFYLAVNAAASLEEIRARFPSIAKVGPITKMREIVQAALPGVPLRHVPTPPPQLRVLPGYVYFELDRSAPDWNDFLTAPSLGLQVAGDWPQLKLELWCVKRANR